MGILENGQNVFFEVSFWWNSDFLADFFPKVYFVLTNSLIIFAVINILVAVSCSHMPCTRRNLKYCEIIFRFYTFLSFIIFVDHKSQFFTVSYFFFHFFLCKKTSFCPVFGNKWDLNFCVFSKIKFLLAYFFMKKVCAPILFLQVLFSIPVMFVL